MSNPSSILDSVELPSRPIASNGSGEKLAVHFRLQVLTAKGETIATNIERVKTFIFALLTEEDVKRHIHASLTRETLAQAVLAKGSKLETRVMEVVCDKLAVLQARKAEQAKK